jgi:hypothetical protein
MQRQSSRICNGTMRTRKGLLSPKKGLAEPEGQDGIFHSSMIKLGLLCVTVIVLVISMALLRHYLPAPKDLTEL